MAVSTKLFSRLFRRFGLYIGQSIPHWTPPRQATCLSTKATIDAKDSTATQLNSNSSNSEDKNDQCRVDLAAAYQILDYLGYGEGIDNHLTLRAPSNQAEKEVMLVVPYGLHWSQVTASRLIGVDFETGETVEGRGNVDATAFCIHRAIHRARSGDGANCVMHTHQPYATTISCLKDPRLLMLHQNSTRFYDKIAYDQNFDGIPDMDENIAEGDRMARAFSQKEIMLMGNHGVTAIGPTVPHAFNALYFMERVCELQVLAMSTGRELFELPQDQVEKTAKTWKKYDYIAPIFFDSMKEVIIAKGSKFMT